jgi:hypothetical protein
MSNEIFDFEVTEVLRQKGIRRIEKQGDTIAVILSADDKVIRSTIYKSDFNKTTGALKRACSPHIHDKLIIQEIILIISKRWNELTSDNNNGNDTSSRNTNAGAIYDEIRKDKAANGDVPPEKWRITLLEKYNNLMKVIDENLPQLWLQIELQLSVKSILHIKDSTLPLAVIVLGAPSSLKTQGIELFRKWPTTYYTDNFSARAFVSHNTSVKKEQLPEIDLLPKLKNKMFLTPELAPLFAAKDDDLLQTLTIITRVIDGHGYFSNSGAHGGRGYDSPMMFVWIGAAVDIPRKVHKHLSTLGPKLYFLRLPKEFYNNPEDEYLKQIKGIDFGKKVSVIHDALFGYLKWFELCPYTATEQSSGLQKIEWDDDKDDEESNRYIIRLGRLLGHLRASVPTWDTSHSQGSEYAYSIATIEEPTRAITQLSNSPRLTHIFNDISDSLLGGCISDYRLVWISRDPLLIDNYQMNGLVLNSNMIIKKYTPRRYFFLKRQLMIDRLGLSDDIQIKIKISGSRGYFFLKRALMIDYVPKLVYNKIKISGSRGYFFLKRALVV